MSCRNALAWSAALLLLTLSRFSYAQPPIDLAGQWVAIVNEDWRWRMRTPPAGDYESVQTLNQRGRAAADTWTPAQDGSCQAYGAGGLMRMPTRLRIDWLSDQVLRLQTDAGSQTRLFHFDAVTSADVAPTLQGHSRAQWVQPLPPPGPMGFSLPPGAAPPRPGGSLTVETSHLVEGWLRRNGVPYSDQTILTEHFDMFNAPNGDQWLVVTSIVADPVYHSGRYITSSHFRRDSDMSAWSPTTCASN